MKHALSLFVVLYGLWLLLSGHWHDPFLLGLGVVSAALTVFVAWRMEGLDHEGVPVSVVARALAYWPWLLWQIVLANFQVARRILDPGPHRPAHGLGAGQPEDRPGQGDLCQLHHADAGDHLGAGGGRTHFGPRPGGESIDALEDGDMDRRASWVDGAADANVGGALRCSPPPVCSC